MADVSWIKVVTDLFGDKKIKLIQAMPEGDSIVLLWLRMLCLAGKTNAHGVIMVDEDIPYSMGDLSNELGKSQQFVEFALKTFMHYKFIEIDDYGRIYIINWEKHQNVDGMEKIKLQNKVRKQKQRAKQKLLALSQGQSQDSHVTVTGQSQDMSQDKSRDVTPMSQPSHATEKERELEKEKEKISLLISEPENQIAIIPKLKVLEALNKYEVEQDGGVVHLEYIESYLGVMEDALILDAIKRSSGSAYSYCRKILTNWNKKGYRRYLDVPENQVQQAVKEYAAAGVDKPGRSAKGNSANKSDEAGNVRDVTNGQTGRIIYAERD